MALFSAAGLWQNYHDICFGHRSMAMPFVGNSFVLLFFLLNGLFGPVQAAVRKINVSEITAECSILLRSEEEAPTTLSGLASKRYFEQKNAVDGRPRYVLLIGAPGSGKSTWAQSAQAQGWTVLSTDAFRQEKLQELRNQNKVVPMTLRNAFGQHEVIHSVPDPWDPQHLFSVEYQAYGFERLHEVRGRAFETKRSIVDDKVNGNLLRVEDVQLAYDQGYSVEALVFVSPSIDHNLENVALRQRRGGIPLSPHVTARLFKAMRFFTSEIQVNPKLRRLPALPKLDPVAVRKLRKLFQDLVDFYPDLRTALHQVAASDHELLRALIERDVYNRVEFVPVPSFAR